jgi:hypothetical protein
VGWGGHHRSSQRRLAGAAHLRPDRVFARLWGGSCGKLGRRRRSPFSFHSNGSPLPFYSGSATRSLEATPPLLLRWRPFPGEVRAVRPSSALDMSGGGCTLVASPTLRPPVCPPSPGHMPSFPSCGASLSLSNAAYSSPARRGVADELSLHWRDVPGPCRVVVMQRR